MKKFAGLIIISIFFIGCATIWQQAVCRHNAIYAAITWSDMTGQPVGIAVGYWHDMTARHAQAFTISSAGKIQWLKVYGDDVRIGEKDNFRPYKLMTVGDFIKQHVKVVNPTQEELDELLKQLYKK